MTIAIARCIIAATLLAAPSAFASTLQWESDPAAAFARAKSEKKPIFIDFYATWCEPCRQMDGRTFRDRKVVERLSQFVLLRINVDSSDLDEKYKVRSFPTYSIREPGDRPFYTFFGFHEARPFAEKLDLLLKPMPEFLAAAEALREKQSAEGFMRLGMAYDRATAFPQARDIYKQASAAATKEGDAQLAQVALIESAIARIKAGEIVEGIEALTALAAAPHDADTEAAIWLGIGFGEEARKDRAKARSAYQKAATVATAGTPLRQQIERRLAKLSE